ncbi:hypothetical protein TcasGA2_TC032900 [Tribolium castaneum]|uniref:Uncharacterized protein n=1 Tax=Tribolium castaneum TaxID=7070 RepID=A0A139WJW1_TRICA|nr:hypothetical protein TcasGA2_TC032900 [Tribolium castaneum]
MCRVFWKRLVEYVYIQNIFFGMFSFLLEPVGFFEESVCRLVEEDCLQKMDGLFSKFFEFLHISSQFVELLLTENVPVLYGFRYIPCTLHGHLSCTDLPNEKRFSCTI